MKISKDRFLADLRACAEIGADPRGGITRTGYSDAEDLAFDWLEDRLHGCGITVRRDSVGNLIADLPGRSGRYLAVGSHLDTVPRGGAYDGALGVIAGLECLRTAAESTCQLEHGLRLLVFRGEEGGAVGGTFGSRCYSGTVTHVSAEDLAEVGLTEADVRNAAADPRELIGYLEMHIEQGAVLDDTGVDIGAVTGIVGIRRYAATVSGRANHAGTTPMALRNDALRKAAETLRTFYRLVDDRQDSMVGTVGKLTVQPGAVNVIPGQVDYIIEMRAVDLGFADEVAEALLAEHRSMGLSLRKIVDKGSVRTDPRMIEAVVKAAAMQGLSCRRMPSGAGHDANPMAKITPTGMIFVPSVNGISHAPDEFTKDSDCIKGAQVLLETVILLSGREEK